MERNRLADAVWQFYIAWVVAGIIWLWATLFVATLYPIIDGGYQRILQVYRVCVEDGLR
jgi:hypothetical protein